MTGGARAVVEMNAEPLCGCLDFLERRQCLGELFCGKKTILRLETLWSLLGPSIRGNNHESQREHDWFETWLIIAPPIKKPNRHSFYGEFSLIVARR
jgi:hypothetical protein